MKLVLRGKQNKTKHVVHVKVINLRWILSFLFFLPLSQILLSAPSPTCRGQSHSCAGSHLLLGAKWWCFTTLCPMQGRQILHGGVRVLRTSNPRAGFSSCSPHPQVPPEPPPSIFPEQVARTWAAQAQLTWRMLMVVYRDLFSSRKRDGPSGTLLSLSWQRHC